ncbi:uncharacterized protein LOC130779207 [Actinidia eriantha]|uniref:uncharacterized protein LOC130778975 n=1 Tax=Actinidia eriantha TaxID=165200 RepID=UPI002582F2BD|nr:uncharacterized protein LOC130778975 [Actinidia eriantha]XP_057493775.1 uncharacterized protein LOC130779207 [Actinidia eriantha]
MSDNPLLPSSTLDVAASSPPRVPRRLTPEQVILLESLEKRMNKLHIEELNLEKRADDTLTALGTNAQMLMAVSIGSNVILPGSMSCAGGVVLSSLSTISFGLAFLVAVSIAYSKINRLVTPVAELKRSLADLHQNVREFKSETEPLGLTRSAFESNHSMRIEALEQEHQFETTDFWAHYKHMLIWILIVAVVQWITSFIVATVFFCKGKAPGDRAPKFAPPRPT